MTAATVTSKGQVTIPAEVRQALHVGAGDRIEFVQVEPGRFEIVAATRPVTDLKGLFRKHRKPVSIAAMNAAIAARGASARIRFGRGAHGAGVNRNDDMVTLTAEINPALGMRLDQASAREHVSKSELVRRAIAAYVGHAEAPFASALDQADCLAGCFSGGPKDLASNPKHLKDFGRA